MENTFIVWVDKDTLMTIQEKEENIIVFLASDDYANDYVPRFTVCYILYDAPEPPPLPHPRSSACSFENDHYLSRGE